MNSFFVRILKNNQGSDFIAQLVVYALQIISGVFVGAYVARYLGAQQLGVISLLVTLVAISNPLIDMGTSTVLVKEFSQKKDDLNSVFWSLLSLKCALSLIMLLALYYLAGGGIIGALEKLSPMILLLGVSGVIFVPFAQFGSAVTAVVKNKNLMIGQIVTLLVVVVARITCVSLELDLEWFLAIYLLSSLMLLFNLVWVSFKNSLMPKIGRVSLLGGRRILRESWPLIISGLAYMLYLKIDILMIGLYSSVEDVGVYTVSSRLLDILFFIPVAFSKSISSKVYEFLKDASPSQEKETMKNVFRLSGFLGTVFVLASALGGWLAIPWIYGDQYSLSVPAFCVATIALPAVFLGLSRNFYLINKQKNKFLIIANILGALINVVLNIVFLPRFGIIGASLATVVSYYMASVVSSLLIGDSWIFNLQVKSFCFSPKRLKQSYVFLFSNS